MNIPTECARCGNRLMAYTMSYFNQDYICIPDCVRRERDHPEFARAHQREVEQVMKGNYRFEGVGCPPDLYINGKQPTNSHLKKDHEAKTTNS